jgi:hypothetical protein
VSRGEERSISEGMGWDIVGSIGYDGIQWGSMAYGGL